MIISSWLNFGRPAPPGRGSAAEKIFGFTLLQPARSVCVSLSAFFIGAVAMPTDWSKGIAIGSVCVFVCLCVFFEIYYIWFLWGTLCGYGSWVQKVRGQTSRLEIVLLGCAALSQSVSGYKVFESFALNLGSAWYASSRAPRHPCRGEFCCICITSVIDWDVC